MHVLVSNLSCRLMISPDNRCVWAYANAMSDADTKPTVTPSTPVTKAAPTTAAKVDVKSVAKVESTPAVKPADSTAAKPTDTPATKPIVKAENRQAGKGSKRRPFNAKVFGANYQSIQWGHGQAQRPKH